jgi:hypothetical protein
MLSPKKPKPDIEAVGKLLLLDEYECVADGLVFQDTLNDVVTRFDNKPTSQSLDHRDLAVFLTRCVEACHDALDKQQYAPPRQDRWYKDLQFSVGNSPAAPSGEFVPFKPNIVAGQGLSALGHKTLYRDPLEAKSAHRITLLVETEGSWKVAVSQASDNARRLFGASRIRSFALVLAFNQDSNALRFLIFHHGGLTASEPCNITELGGFTEVVRIFLALAFWSTPVGAKFIPSCTDTKYALPADHLGKNYTLAAVGDVLSRSLRIRGKMTLVSRLHPLQNSPAEGGFF